MGYTSFCTFLESELDLVLWLKSIHEQRSFFCETKTPCTLWRHCYHSDKHGVEKPTFASYREVLLFLSRLSGYQSRSTYVSGNSKTLCIHHERLRMSKYIVKPLGDKWENLTMFATLYPYLPNNTVISRTAHPSLTTFSVSNYWSSIFFELYVANSAWFTATHGTFTLYKQSKSVTYNWVILRLFFRCFAISCQCEIGCERKIIIAVALFLSTDHYWEMNRRIVRAK